jgi:D-alanine-D-alanine ligase
MTIGFTYDLKSDYLAAGFSEEAAAEFDVPETIEGIIDALTSMGHEVEPIGNARHLISLLEAGKRWDLVFNICEGVSGSGREAQVPAILELYDVPYTFSDALIMSLTLHKGMCKRVIRDMGLPTAPFALVERADDIDSIDLAFPLFVKPVSEGTGKGIDADSLVYNKDDLKKVCLQRLHDFRQAVLVEGYLPGREFSVGIVGNAENAMVIGIMEVVVEAGEQGGIYSYESKARYEELVRYHVPEEPLFGQCADIALRAWRGLGCRDGGRIDLKLDENGVPVFLEVNPLAGLNPAHSDLPILARMSGIGFNELIGMILQASCDRLGIQKAVDGIAAQVNTSVGKKNRRGSGKKALILHSQLQPNAPEDELDVLDQADYFFRGLTSLGFEAEIMPAPYDLRRMEYLLQKINPEFVVNLMETVFSDGRLVHLGPALLEHFQVAYTGCPADAIFLTSNKIISKQIMRSAGIPTPLFFTENELAEKDRHIPDSLFVVKSVWEHASFGLDEREQLLFRGRDELSARFSKEGRTSSGSFAEEYIHGREFNVSIIGGKESPEVLPAAELKFDYPVDKPRIVGYRAKWDETSYEYLHTSRCFDFPASDEALLQQLGELCLKCWQVFSLRGYARVDFRVDETGHIFVLEINANPCISADAGFVAAAERAGLTQKDIVKRILNDTLKPQRHE